MFILFHTVSYCFILFQACGAHGQGIQRLNINLLKPEKIAIAARGGIICLKNAAAVAGWVHYQPRLQCPLLRYLPHFLATFLVENLAEALNLPEPPAIKPRQSFYKDNTGRQWSIGTLNKILNHVLVSDSDGTQIAVVGCAEWESEKFNGFTKAHVRTLDKYFGSHRRVNMNHSMLFHTISYCFILFHTVSFSGMLCFDSATTLQKQ